MILFVVTLVFASLYIFFLAWSLMNWMKIEDKSSLQVESQDIKVSVVVPVRNEEGNILHLLESLGRQDYPKENYQVIISDDHSTDRTSELVKKFIVENEMDNFSIVYPSNESKKEALAFAIGKANGELIITTDGDVTMGNDWMTSIVSEFIRSNSKMICCPVKLVSSNSVFEQLQKAEFIGLSGIGASGISAGLPIFCNGANLAFTKDVFIELNGYEGSLSYSGDDTQLMLKIHRMYPGKINFLKDKRAMVVTNAIKRKAEFMKQRRRWASKIPSTLSSFAIFVSVLTWIVHFLLLTQIVSAIINQNILQLLLPLVIISLMEIIFIHSIQKFFDEKILAWLILAAKPFYSFYIVVAGLMVPFKSYEWKGRKLN